MPCTIYECMPKSLEVTLFPRKLWDCWFEPSRQSTCLLIHPSMQTHHFTAYPPQPIDSRSGLVPQDVSFVAPELGPPGPCLLPTYYDISAASVLPATGCCVAAVPSPHHEPLLSMTPPACAPRYMFLLRCHGLRRSISVPATRAAGQT